MIVIIQGEDRVLTFRLVDDTGAPFDLTAATQFDAYFPTTTSPTLHIPNSQISVLGDAKLGTIQITLTKANTALINASDAPQDFTLDVTFGATKRIFNVLQSITINAPSVATA